MRDGYGTVACVRLDVEKNEVREMDEKKRVVSEETEDGDSVA